MNGVFLCSIQDSGEYNIELDVFLIFAKLRVMFISV